jgi:hypothetical protein
VSLTAPPTWPCAARAEGPRAARLERSIASSLPVLRQRNPRQPAGRGLSLEGRRRTARLAPHRASSSAGHGQRASAGSPDRSILSFKYWPHSTAQHSTIEAPKERGTVGGQMASGSHGILVLAAGRGPGRPRATSVPRHPAGFGRGCRAGLQDDGSAAGARNRRLVGASGRRIPEEDPGDLSSLSPLLVRASGVHEICYLARCHIPAEAVFSFFLVLKVNEPHNFIYKITKVVDDLSRECSGLTLRAVISKSLVLSNANAK